MMEKVTTTTLRYMMEKGEKITVLSAYDHPTARMIDEAGIDVVLVGDSLGNVILGYKDTLAVTMDEMIHHTKAVA
ncbi:MAG: 3-methyl-2-oxobutanoate hydroxymethyltransferase, partial [Candidatus Hadarchaeum sp.]|nr:3-methyl-2-oxobutanoate hydroxymethyltransferase [Candidatus Hadarchaeum sp.]